MRNRLRAWLRVEADFQVVGEVPNGPSAVRCIERTRPDLAFLHVHLPGLGGFDVLDTLAGLPQPPAVVFLADESIYAVRAFRTRAIDFLQIPFSVDRLRQSLDRARRQLRTQPRRLAGSSPAAASVTDRLALRVNRRLVVVRFDEICWVRASLRKSELHLADGTVLAEIAFGTLEQRLPKPAFVQINRSIMVRRDYVREIRRKTHGDHWVVFEDDERHVLSRNRRRNVLRLLGWPA